MYGWDVNLYSPATADFHAAMTDILLAGFPVDIWGGNTYFDQLQADQVAIGLPVGQNATESGYNVPSAVIDALDYIILGKSY